MEGKSMDKKTKVLLTVGIVLVILAVAVIVFDKLYRKHQSDVENSIVTTSAVTNLTKNSATLNGNANAQYSGTRRLQYGIDPSGGKCQISDPIIVNLGIGTGDFSTNLNNLASGTDYCYQAVLASTESSKTYSGKWISFQTAK